MSWTRWEVKTEHLVARTFSQCRTLVTDHHTHLRVAQVWDVLHLCAFKKSSTHIMFHRPLLDVPDPLSSLWFHVTDLTAVDWNQGIFLRHSARKISVLAARLGHSSKRIVSGLVCLWSSKFETLLSRSILLIANHQSLRSTNRS